jgi:hypothetical protein
MNTKRTALIGLSLTSVLLAAGCGSSTKTAATTVAPAATTAAPTATTAAAMSTLKGVCPDKVIIQTDWFPEAEHGAVFNLLGPDAKTSKDTGATLGTLTAGGKAQGVQLEIRSGGPLLGDQTVVSQMYKDKSIMLGFVSTDEAIKFSTDTPVVGVVAPQDKSPQVILWDKKSHPTAKTIADIAKEVDEVTVFGGATYIDFLTSTGVVPKAKANFNYKGDKILAKPGADKIAHQGFATAEPFQYAHLETGAIDVGYGLVYDTGWKLYPEALSARTDALADPKIKTCLKALVPMIQQSQIDYIANHTAADAIIIDAVKVFDTFWKQSQADTDNSVKLQKELGIVGNGTTPTLGDFEDARMADFIAKAIPVLTSDGKTKVKADLKMSDIATNEFIDKAISYK